MNGRSPVVTHLTASLRGPRVSPPGREPSRVHARVPLGESGPRVAHVRPRHVRITDGGLGRWPYSGAPTPSIRIAAPHARCHADRPVEIRRYALCRRAPKTAGSRSRSAATAESWRPRPGGSGHDGRRRYARGGAFARDEAGGVEVARGGRFGGGALLGAGGPQQPVLPLEDEVVQAEAGVWGRRSPGTAGTTAGPAPAGAGPRSRTAGTSVSATAWPASPRPAGSRRGPPGGAIRAGRSPPGPCSRSRARRRPAGPAPPA